jgi:hypothetical protein
LRLLPDLRLKPLKIKAICARAPHKKWLLALLRRLRGWARGADAWYYMCLHDLLVGGWPTPLKSMKVSWDDSYPIYGNIKHVPNHQPVLHVQYNYYFSKAPKKQMQLLVTPPNLMSFIPSLLLAKPIHSRFCWLVVKQYITLFFMPTFSCCQNPN